MKYLKKINIKCDECKGATKKIISKQGSFILKDSPTDMCGWGKDGYKKVDRLVK